MSTTLTVIHDKVLDAIGTTPTSAGLIAARCQMSVKETVSTLYDLQEAGAVKRVVTNRSALAEWERV